MDMYNKNNLNLYLRRHDALVASLSEKFQRIVCFHKFIMDIQIFIDESWI